MSRRPLLEYNIRGAGLHCVVDIFVNDERIITLDTGTKYEESAEEEIAELIKNKFFGDCEDVYEEGEWEDD